MSSPRPHPALPPLPLATPTTITHPDLGTLTGSLLTDPVTKQALCKRFTGVPYARPPTRWKRAEAFDFEGGWRYGNNGETYEAWGGVCPQRKYTLHDYRDNPYSWPADPSAKYTEDCLQVNIWTPVEDPPEGQLWPVLFYIHGGWLQVGHNNQGRRYDASYMIGEEALKCVVVAPGYRLNLFGFLTCNELVKEGGYKSLNLGLWDQKLALDWTFQNIHHFQGSPDHLSIAGLSAGAHSTHQQLHHLLSHPPASSSTPYPKGIILYSNAIPSTPRPISEGQPQFEALCKAVGVYPPSLEALRKIEAAELVKAMDGMEMHTFRVCQDHEGGEGGGGFVGEDAMRRLVSGELGRFCKERGIRVVLGEVANEEGIFSQTNPPTSLSSLHIALNNYYPLHVLTRILPLYSSLHPSDPTNSAGWIALHGQITADVQVYASSRLLLSSLSSSLEPGKDLFHYRIDAKAKVVEEFYTPPALGVSHAHDTPWWWYSRLIGLSDEDLAKSKEWLAPMQAFLEGREVEGWGGGGGMRVMGGDGVVREGQRDERMRGESGERVGKVLEVLRELAREG